MRCRSILATCAVLTSLATGCAATWTSSSRPASETAKTRQISGQVASYTTAPRGEMDGFILDTGNRVHFPVHAGSAVLPYVQKGQVILVVGTLEDRPDGKVIEAKSITNTSKNETLDVSKVSPPKPQPQLAGGVAPPGKGGASTTTLTGAELTTKEGRVQGYTSAPNGDMDGVTLDNGSRVHFPAHVGKAVVPLLQQGKTVRIIGWELTGPEGTILEATKITATPSGQTVDIAAIPIPKPVTVTPGAVAPPGAPPLESTQPSTPQSSAPPATRVR